MNYKKALELYKEGKISKEKFIEEVENYKREEYKKADEYYNNVRNKEIAHGAIDIGLSAIPFGTIGMGAKLSGKIASKMVPYIGKKISNSISKGLVDGSLTGISHGTLSNVIDNKKANEIIKESAKEGIMGGAIGGSIGAIGGKAIQKIEGENLKKFAVKDKIKHANKYYTDYERGANVINKELGKIKMTSDAFKETTIQNTKLSNNVIGLSKDLKAAKYVGAESPKHEHKKFKIEKFHRLKGKNADYLIAENNKRDKYFHKVVDPEVTVPKTEPQSLPNSIIPDKKGILNPLYSILSDNNIQEGIKETINKSSQMSAYQNMEKKDKPYWDKSFVNFDGISLNGKKWRDWSELEKKSFIEGFNEGKLGNPDKYPWDKLNKNNNDKKHWTDEFNIGNPDTDNGHWVTMPNGKHLFIKD